MTIEDFFKMIDNVKEQLSTKQTKDGKIVVKSVDNYIKILNLDTRFANTIKYNDFSEKIDIVGASWNKDIHSFEDSDHNHIISCIEKSYGIYSNEKLTQALDIIARKNSYNPIKDLLKSLTWDGIDRISTLFSDTLGAEINEYNSNVAKLMLLGAINRIHYPGCKFDYCVIFSSENTQGLGKSSLIRKLAMNDKYFTDSLTNLDGEKDTFQILKGKWFVELGELKALNRCKGGAEGVKQFLSKQNDTYRDSYARYTKDIKRKCIFIGTTNKGEYLIDDTGNRRFLPVICADKGNLQAMERIKYHMYDDTPEINNYVKQLWAQAMVIFRSGKYSLVLDKNNETMLNGLHEQARIYNPMVDEIQNYINELPNGAVIGIFDIYINVYNPNAYVFQNEKRPKIGEIPQKERNEIKSILQANEIKGLIKNVGQRRTECGGNYKLTYTVIKDFETITDEQTKELHETFKQSKLEL